MSSEVLISIAYKIGIELTDDHIDMTSMFKIIKTKWNDNIYFIRNIKNVIINDKVMNMKGLIFQTSNIDTLDDFKVLSCLPKQTINVTDKSIDEQKIIIDNIKLLTHKPTITPIIDGTVIRLAYINDNWVLSTNSRYDAYTAYWMIGESFGDIFMNVMKEWYDSHIDGLNKDYIYVFVICSQYINNVIQYNKCAVLHQTTIDRQTMTEVLKDGEVEYIDVSQVKKYWSGVDIDIDQIINEVNDDYLTYNPIRYAGYIVDTGSEKYRFESFEYRYVKQNIRANYKNIIEMIIHNHLNKTMHLLRSYYPSIGVYIDMFEYNIYNVYKILYDLYKIKIIQKSNIFINKSVYILLMNYHINYYNTIVRPQKRPTNIYDIITFCDNNISVLELSNIYQIITGNIL